LKAKIENRATSEKSKGLIRILQPAIFTVLLIAGISFGVMMGAKVTGIQTSQNTVDEMYYFNEMGDEPIESYFLN
jgi:flagellar basal body-associated protein FliL